MIGAEIIALVSIIIGVPTTWLWWWRRRLEAVARERHMEAALDLAISRPGYQPLDVFLATWGHRLPKVQLEHVTKLREDRYITETK